MTEDNFRIAVDVMGSDNGPAEVIAGVALAIRKKSHPGKFVLVGKETLIQDLLAAEKLSGDSRIQIHPASEVIGMDEKPIQSLKQKKDSSLVRTVELVKDGTCAAAVSCGNTGSLMACSTLRLRPLRGLSKPALATVWPSKDRHFVVLDAGANPQCKPENLLHYAILGSLYAQDVLNLPKPRVGLLTIGTEEGKGNDLTNETHQLLKKINGLINYVGLVEGFQLFKGEIDVIVTDGFTGNVVLKSCESLYHMIKSLTKEELTRNPLRMLGTLLSSGAYRSMRKRLDPELYSGAPLLGLNGMVIKSHGSAKKEDIASAIRIASMVIRKDYRHQALAMIAQANQLAQISIKAEEALPAS